LDSKSKFQKGVPVVLKVFACVFAAIVLYIISAIKYAEIYSFWGAAAPRDYWAYAGNGFGITVMVCIGIFILLLLFIWKIFKLRWRLVTAGVIVALMAGGLLFHISQENILEIHEPKGWTGEVNLIEYEPFREGTLAKDIDAPSALSLQENLPRLDGATALYPLYAAFARATYPEDVYSAYDQDSGITCSRTSEAFEQLLAGEADIAFLMGVSKEQRAQANQQGLELMMTPIGKEAFVFFVNRRNAMSDLSVENIIDIYAGRVRNWKELGGQDLEIFAYQRPETSGSQAMLREIMGDTPIAKAPRENYFDMMMGMYTAVAYKNHRNSVGYSFRYYINDMIDEDEIKFLAIDGVAPTPENIASGAYPFAHDFYAVTVVREMETDANMARIRNTEKLIDWIVSPQGQSLVEKTGYVPMAE